MSRRADRTREPDLSAGTAAGDDYSPSPAASLSDAAPGPFARTEIRRMADRGVGLDRIAALYLLSDKALRQIIEE
jgi:hypothetical protein